MLLGTTYVKLNEPCLGLYELDFLAPDKHEKHRYQIIVVMRGDKGDTPAEFRTDLGKTKKFKGVDPFRIPGGLFKGGRYHIVHTVAELKDIARELRGHGTIWDKKDLIKVDKFKE